MTSPTKSDTSGMSLADFKANYSTPAPASSASVGIAGKTYTTPGTGKAYVGPNYTEDSKVKTAGKGLAGSGTPLGTSIAGSNLSKGNVAKTAIMAVTFGGVGPAAGLGSYVKSKVNNTAIGIGINAAEDYMGNALANLASKLPNAGGKLKSIWTSNNADLPPNITALALQRGTIPNITIDNGTLRKNYMDSSFKDTGYFRGKLDRKVIGTYDGKPFELETVDGLTLIRINGKLINDDDIKYQEILDAAIDHGYELQDKMLMKKDYGMNPN